MATLRAAMGTVQLQQLDTSKKVADIDKRLTQTSGAVENMAQGLEHFMNAGVVDKMGEALRKYMGQPPAVERALTPGSDKVKAPPCTPEEAGAPPAVRPKVPS